MTRLLRFCHMASCVPLLVLIVITSCDVVARYALATSVPDTVEISSLMLGLLISLALAPTTAQGGQVRFDVLVEMMPRLVKDIVHIFTLVLALVIFGLMGWQAVHRVIYSRTVGEYVGALGIVVWPAKAVFAFGCLLTALALLSATFFYVRRLLGGSDEIGG